MFFKMFENISRRFKTFFFKMFFFMIYLFLRKKEVFISVKDAAITSDLFLQGPWVIPTLN